MRGKSGRGKSVKWIGKGVTHMWNWEVGIRMVVIFEYILRAHSGGVRAIISLKFLIIKLEIQEGHPCD